MDRNDYEAACIEAVNKYLSKSVNFGEDSFAMRMAETDAFISGWTAALAFISSAD